MIGKITGRLDHVGEDYALVEAAGVGYILYCAPATLAALPRPGEEASLYTELVVREDLLQLYGFRTLAEREWHRLLTSVQGVGAKVSLAILGALGPEGVSRAIALSDAATIRTAPGVGPKLAARIVNELADKAPSVTALPPPVASPPGATPRKTASAPATEASPADALSALVNLGYDRAEAARTIAEVAGEAPPGTASLIKAALQRLSERL